MGVVRHWNRLHREVVDALSLGNVQGQAGWGCEQSGLVEGVLAHRRGLGIRCSLTSLPTQTI